MRSFNGWSGILRESISGCSFEIFIIRAPACKMPMVSAECIKPSTVKSTMKSTFESASTAFFCPVRAKDEPLDLIIAGLELIGVGSFI